MALIDLSTLVRDNLGTLGLAVLAFITLAALVLTVHGPRRHHRHYLSPAESLFRNVFAIMSEDRRQSLITYYQQKHECS